MTTPNPAPAPPWWLDDLRFEPAPPYLNMGTRALDLDRWLIIDDDRDADLTYRADLLATVRDVVFAAIPGAGAESSEAASVEANTLVREWLLGRGISPAEPRPEEHPLIDAARLVQEDLLVMQHIDGQWVLTAGVVCFPSHWTVGDKVGLPLEGIHVPVAHYEHELSRRVDTFHDRLRVDRPVWRRNWAVNPTSEQHLPAFGMPMHPVSTIEPDGAPMWIRSEYQTLRRLQLTDAILFTIRIQRTPLGVLLHRRDLAAKMLATVVSWDASKRRYASTGSTLTALIDWLGSVVDGRGSEPR